MVGQRMGQEDGAGGGFRLLEGDMGKHTNKTVDSLVRASIPGKSNDGNGLYLQISKAGSSSWIFRYKYEGKRREMGLGGYPIITLAEARRLTTEQCRTLAAGIDPPAARGPGRAAERPALPRRQDVTS